MPRPHKQTVDYFPHYCAGGKTLFILQSKFGNDGYAFWFKILSLLGRSEGHFYDYNSRAAWEFLLAETCVTEDTANNILATLIELDAIDKDLAEQKIIWVQHFVDNLADVYKRRQINLPTKPGENTRESAFSITQTDDLKVAGMIKYYEDTKGRIPTPSDLERLKEFADEYPDGWYEKALADYPTKPLSYIAKVMENWKEEGVNPLDARRAKAHQRESTTTAKLKQSTSQKLR